MDTAARATAEEAEQAYDVTDLSAPKLNGKLLEVFACVAGNRGVIGRAVSSHLMKKNGFAELASKSATIVRARGFRADAAYEWSDEAPNDLPKALGDAASFDSEQPVTCADYQAAYRSGSITPDDICAWLLDGGALLPEVRGVALNAVVRHDVADIRNQFSQSTERWKRGQPLSPLDGVPCVVKDELHVKGYVGSCGCGLLEEKAMPWHEDAECVANLRAAGAIIVGKTLMNELGLGMNGFNSVQGQCCNPYDVRREPAGSSSGSAAAVAAGICPIAVGCDGGGSIRMPSGKCGVVGLKPSKGKVPEHGNVVDVTRTLGHIGPIAASAEDAALLLHYMTAKRSPEDAAPTLTVPDVSNLKVGVYWPWFHDCTDARVKELCEKSLNAFVEKGATLVPIVLPNLNRMARAHSAIILKECRSAMEQLVGREAWNSAVLSNKIGLEVRMKVLSGEAMDRLPPSADGDCLYDTAMACRQEAIHNFAAALRSCDVIVTPTQPGLPAFHANNKSKLDVAEDARCMRFMLAGNMTGLPCITFNIGYVREDGRDLPVGLQFMGKMHSDHRLLQLAALGRLITSPWRRPELYVLAPLPRVV